MEKTTLKDLPLFNGQPQHETLANMKFMLPTRRMEPAARPWQFGAGMPAELPPAYEFDGARRESAAFLADTDTSALLVLKAGEIRHEQYWLTGGPDVQWISFSVAKSFVSALVGIAIAEGFIAGLDSPISDYVSVPPGSAYDGVMIKDVLQMSSGARWDETYSDPGSEVFRLGAAMGQGGSLLAFVRGMIRDTTPGTLCRYNSGDTQMLGQLLVAATGRSISDYMHEKLMRPLGMNAAGYWLIDSAGMEMAFAGVNLIARDFAKLGELYRRGGMWDGREVVPAAWVRASVTPDAPHLLPGSIKSVPFGYGYQWWVPESERGEFLAAGVYNQFVYVDPSREVVIVKLSANRRYGTTMTEATNRQVESVALFRAIAGALD
ncbi:serine hydrolase domain-containing protein [Paraburkholderia saeva]|uniref:Beta-lactamase-related domain-containing protein n=1 Tax=Paraburkholderia saeva TaxID=2777537 RepID=A0A9N8S0S1_9BURK|nr:serine hydrolase [Paraburkholderia saeva]CAG4912000.1 hypothetical protein R70241_03986 [Paraburkholderia saeva]CAG4924824.1 hypothetical protein LMG31841_05424 [Paraburkholderia saeva]